MNFTEYTNYFEAILSGKYTNAPYDDEHFLEYVKLNYSRLKRWLKTGVLSENTRSTIQSIRENQDWVIITEPWCGDAAHIVPFVMKMASLNPLIQVNFQLRDSIESEINRYLTDGSRSVPKLIVRTKDGEDLLVWGPRPFECHAYYLDLKNQEMEIDAIKIALQKWYNDDEGRAIQNEICALLNKHI